MAFTEPNDPRAPSVENSSDIDMISASVTPGGSAIADDVSARGLMASVCDSNPPGTTNDAAPLSHTTDDMPTRIDTVTLKCDLNDYLINLTNVRCSLTRSDAAASVACESPVAGSIIKQPIRRTMQQLHKGNHTDGPSYTRFDELVRCTERERQWRLARSPIATMPRMRLCGGGEDSINNGTSAWGTPPGAASNGTVSAWGVLPNQQQVQQQQQQAQPQPAWGGNAGNANNNNNNNGPTGAVGNGNGATGSGGAMQQRGGGSVPLDPNSNKATGSQPGAPNAWNATANHNRGSSAGGGTNAVANVTNNNGNLHHSHNQHQPVGPAGQGQPQQQQAGNGTAKNQLEVLSTMRDALFSQDGWGGQHVNQDTNWEVPGSPEPQGAIVAAASANAAVAAAKPDGGVPSHGAGPGGWKAQTMNNGTELWETNLRNGGGVGSVPHLQHQQQQQQQQQPTVSHLGPSKGPAWVPANNLGGTWMEDDDGTGGVGPEAGASVWNGSSAALVAGTVPLGQGIAGGGGPGPGVGGPSPGAGWGALNNGNVVGSPSATGGGMWPPGGGVPAIATATAAVTPTSAVSMSNVAAIGVKKDLSEWGGAAAVGSVGPAPMGVAGGPNLQSQGGWDARTGVPGGAGSGQAVGGFNLASAMGGGQSNAALGDRVGGGGDLRGDPRGISGRLNGAAAGGMWGAAMADQRASAQAGGGGGGLPGSVGGAGGPQQWGGNNNATGMGSGSNKIPSGWDDGRPAALDDATGGGALWGQGSGPLHRQNSAGWKDMGDVMMRPGAGGPMQRNQQQSVQTGGGSFVGPVPSANAPGGVRLSLGKGADASWMGRNGSWEDATPAAPGWGDEKGAPWNMDLMANGGMGGGGGWNKTPTTPKSAGLEWPDPNELGASAGGGMDWCLGGKPSGGGGSNKQPPLGNPLELIRTSKEYRLLCETGHKKEDVEFALRTTNMNIDDALELLRHGAAVAGLSGSGWRRPLSDDHAGGGGAGGGAGGGGGGLGGMGFDRAYSGRIPPLNHAASGLSYLQNNQSMLNNIPGGGINLDGTGPANLVALNNLKYLSQGSGSAAATAGHPSFNHNSLLPPGGRGPNQQQQQPHQQQQLAAAAAGQPSSQQLRMLVQQIQLAVQNGFLSHQILNQPLAPQTFILLNQLLTHIKQMQLTQSNLARSGATGGVSAVQLTLAINKHKTQIAQLQQQIAAQQSIYLKQQQQQQQQQQQGHQSSMGPPPPPLMSSNPAANLGMDFLRQQQQQQQQHQDLMALHNTFGEMALGKDPLLTSSGGVFPPPVVPLQQQQQQQHAVASATAGNVGGGVVVSGSTSQQSRLNQWKLPSLDKDPSAGKDDLTDFSRAPGPTGKSGLTNTTTSSNISALGLVQDGTWATGRANLGDDWPEQTGDNDGKDWATNATTTNPSSQDNSAFNDLVVPEFEPGKPWKGTQLKIEDDPSITPGSVARSPISISTAKDSELFGGASVTDKLSPVSAADGGGLNLTSSAWSFNTASLTSVAGGGAGAAKALGAKSVWSDNSAAASSSAVDVWGTSIGKPSATRGPPPGLGGTTSNKNGGGHGNGGSQRAGGWATAGTSWLLLKNVPSQIDTLTLRALCIQHGAILNFHSYPAHGLALCRYPTREEAAKAQQALNNCTLNSGTINAECPASEAEVQTYLQQLNNTTSGAAASVASSSGSNVTSQSWRQRGSSGSGADTWGSGWALGSGGGAAGSTGSGGGSSLWAPLDGGADHGTPSNLNSFLPDSLLGPELN
ncbi:protein Gawky-like [Anopheles nili]|uniref:protein Gawky-like n=1 Tax=Anopheles nili TaxID=185578 RepID=UPI00237A7DBA|nr:protein Gawky-like [Anopheles nili]